MICRMNSIATGRIARYPGNIMPFLRGDPFAYKRTVENEMLIQRRNPKDPNQAPRREPGDRYVIIGTVLGIVIGCIVGFIIGNNLLGIGGIFIGLIVGAIGGGIIGVTIGSYLKKRSNRPPRKRVETEEKGPFIR